MNRQTGFTLIEVLVAVLVLGLGLLGVAALQANALKTNHSALQRSQATMLAYSMLDAMRANKADAQAGNYNLGTLPDTPACIASSESDPVTPALDTTECIVPIESNLVTRDQARWFAALRNALGNTASALIACDAASCTVKVYWNDSRAGGLSNQVIEVRSKL